MVSRRHPLPRRARTLQVRTLHATEPVVTKDAIKHFALHSSCDFVDTISEKTATGDLSEICGHG